MPGQGLPQRVILPAGFHPTAHLDPHHGWDRPSRPRPHAGGGGGVARTRWEIHTPGSPTAPTVPAEPAAARGPRPDRPPGAADPAGAPPFAYYGGKTRLAGRLAATFPDHGQYCEPFAGSLAVLLAKPPARKETVNDLDRELVGFWRTLRDRPDELIRACALTPHSRVEHASAYHPAGDEDELERARRVWVRLAQARSGGLLPTGWKRFLDPDGPRLSMPGYLAGYLARMPAAAARLAAVSLECRPIRADERCMTLLLCR